MSIPAVTSTPFLTERLVFRYRFICPIGLSRCADHDGLGPASCRGRRSIVSSSHRQVWHHGRLRRKSPSSQSIGRDHITYVSRRFRCVSMRRSRENDTLPRLISAHFFLSRAARGRCDKQGAEGNPHRARAPRRQPEVCHRSADSRYVCCAQSTASLRVTHSTVCKTHS